MAGSDEAPPPAPASSLPRRGPNPPPEIPETQDEIAFHPVSLGLRGGSWDLAGGMA